MALFQTNGETFESVVMIDRETGAEYGYFDLAFVEEYFLTPEQRRQQAKQLKVLKSKMNWFDAALYYKGGTLDGLEAS